MRQEPSVLPPRVEGPRLATRTSARRLSPAPSTSEFRRSLGVIRIDSLPPDADVTWLDPNPVVLARATALPQLAGAPTSQRSESTAVVSDTTRGLVTRPLNSPFMNDSMSSSNATRSLSSIICVSEYESISFR